MAPPVAVQLYTFREELADDPDATLTRIAELGLRTVEPFAVGRGPVADAEALRRRLDAAGLVAPAVHARAPLDDATEAVLDAVEAVGAQTLVIPSPGVVPGFDKASLADPDQSRRLGARIGEAVANAAARGITVGYHNHREEFSHGTYELLLAEAGPDLALEVDVYWAQGGGADPATVVRTHADRVRLLHVKDGTGAHGVPQVAVGDGTIDNRGAIEAGRAVTAHVIEFDVCATDRFDAVRRSAEWLVGQGLSTYG